MTASPIARRLENFALIDAFGWDANGLGFAKGFDPAGFFYFVTRERRTGKIMLAAR